MKPGIHPKYVEASVVCACGNSFTTRSTKPQLRTDLCGVCHPFYTGEQRIVDSAGQVERFLKRMEVVAASEARPSKRQQRLTKRTDELAAQVQRAREAEAAARAAGEEELAAEAAAEAENDARVAARGDRAGGASAPPVVTPIQPAAREAGVAAGAGAEQG